MRGTSRVAGVDPAGVADVFNLEWKDGSDDTLSSLAPGEAVVDDAWAKSNDVDVGDTLRTLGAVRPARRLPRWSASIKDNADFLGNFVDHPGRPAARLRRERRDTYVLADAAAGTEAAVLQDRIEKLLKARYPSAEALNQQQLKDNQEEQLQPLLALVYGLLFLAVLVSIFGIVNTLALSIYERTRELGCCARSA